MVVNDSKSKVMTGIRVVDGRRRNVVWNGEFLRVACYCEWRNKFRDEA